MAGINLFYILTVIVIASGSIPKGKANLIFSFFYTVLLAFAEATSAFVTCFPLPIIPPFCIAWLYSTQ